MGQVSKNHLRKVIAIQKITLEEKAKGKTQKWIFENLIKDQFYISKPTFDNYLARNAKKELKELEEQLETQN